MYASLFYSYVWLFLYLLHAESTSEHLKSPGEHVPRPRGGGPRVPTRLASFPGLHAQHLSLVQVKSPHTGVLEVSNSSIHSISSCMKTRMGRSSICHVRVVRSAHPRASLWFQRSYWRCLKEILMDQGTKQMLKEVYNLLGGHSIQTSPHWFFLGMA